MSTKAIHEPVRITLLGAAGRMGGAIIEAARDYPEVRICAAVVRGDHKPAVTLPEGCVCAGDINRVLGGSDVLVDFSEPESTAAAVKACVTTGKPLVTGVTGLDADTQAKLATASRHIAVLVAPNMSLGANLLASLTGTAAATLGPEFDLEITDIHHREKRDAPSGTALALGQAAAAARGMRLEDCAELARHGKSGARRLGSIGFASLRAGDVAGEHRVLFAGEAESLELVHRATSRAAFARGALVAACWIVHQPAGQYSMSEVLGLGS